ncbi:hypothetical protein [Gluconacetobacter asukensis]|uniref:Uncharacterized protein n=1 Tax=Gluconacetobacter asukensis TaxID=1017181 RepID=A0A7W4J3M3_9PROT|nr:hypothetical protein [Gluconacetobacter asukensis]MBB2174036.1 hypothetical protein [Gluconacetobacter asukensis]
MLIDLVMLLVNGGYRGLPPCRHVPGHKTHFRQLSGIAVTDQSPIT